MSRFRQMVGWFSGKKVRLLCVALASCFTLNVLLVSAVFAQPPAPPATPPTTPAAEDTVVCETKSNIAWLICPVVNATNEAVAALYGFIIDRLQFGLMQPVADDQNGLSGLNQTNYDNLRKSWGTVVRIASGLIVGGVIAILMGQSLAGFNFMDAYTAKRMLPKLLIALVLINTSWFWVSFFIEVGNVAGGAVRDLIIAPFRAGDLGTAAIVADPGAAGSAILLGLLVAGMLAFVIGPGILAVAPLLLGVGIAVLMGMVFVVLRQGLLMILIVTSPLAIVMWIFPGTQKYFNFWQNALSGAILIYPIFQAVVAIGAVLAIITGANVAPDSTQPALYSVFLFVIAVICYFLPFFLIPTLVKFSGSVLGRFGNFVNNPSKGVIDRARNWNKDRRSRMPSQIAKAQRKQQKVEDAKSRAAMLYGKSGFRRFRSAPSIPGVASAMAGADRMNGIHGALARGALTLAGGRRAARAVESRRQMQDAGEAEMSKQLEGMDADSLNDFLATGGDLRRVGASRAARFGPAGALNAGQMQQRQRDFQKLRGMSANGSQTFAGAALAATAKAGRLDAGGIAGAREMYGAGGARSTTPRTLEWNNKMAGAQREALKAGQLYDRADANRVGSVASLQADSIPNYFEALRRTPGGGGMVPTGAFSTMQVLDPSTGRTNQVQVQSFGAAGDQVAAKIAQAMDQGIDARQQAAINDFLNTRVGAAGTAQRAAFDEHVAARRSTRAG